MRKFEDGQIVLADKDNQKLRMVVVSAIECLKGWRYKLAFPKKDGTPNKRKHNRHYFEDQITIH